MNAPTKIGKWMCDNRVRELRWSETQGEFRVELANAVGGWGATPEQALACAQSNQARWSKAA